MMTAAERALIMATARVLNASNPLHPLSFYIDAVDAERREGDRKFAAKIGFEEHHDDHGPFASEHAQIPPDVIQANLIVADMEERLRHDPSSQATDGEREAIRKVLGWAKHGHRRQPGAVVHLMEDIREFHERFDLTYSGPPRMLDAELASFRSKFMQEELDEYDEATAGEEPMTDSARKALAFDAIVDLVYVALGTAYLHGFNFDEAWRRVHHANMQKTRALKAGDSTRGSTYDVVKPPGWTPPSYEGLV